jgi:diguanylate cyclase (GGDEF)-like protein
LTAVANRGALSEALAAVPVGEAFDVAFVDVDDFKNVNDQFGHAGGDELLIAVARRLVNEVRPRDVVARVGGDEFAILLRDVGDANALNVVAQRLLLALSTPYNIAGQTISVTASIGIARATDSRDAEHLLAAADVAMYGAKRNGKNAFRIVG